MEAQVPDTGARLTDLPTEALGVICRSLNLKDRAALSITCRTLLHGLADSEDAWGTLEISKPHKKMPSLLAWLARRQQGLRRLKLDWNREAECSSAAAQLGACLEGSPLVQLRLSELELPGQEGSTALPWLGSCTALTSLALERCGLRTLPDALELLPALAELNLRCNHFEGASWAPLRQLTALTRLDLDFCCMAALPAELAALPALAELDLHFNKGLGAAAEEAWAPLAQCSSLTRLSLRHIPFTRVPAALAALAPHLVDLDFEGAGKLDVWVGGEATLGPLCSLTGLTRLDLSRCLRGCPLPEQLTGLCALEDLSLSGNCLSSNYMAQALRPLRHLTALTQLDLSSCNLEDLPEELSHLTALKSLGLAHNLNSGNDVSWQRLSRLAALTRLVLRRTGLWRIPPELAELRSLEMLVLSDNKDLGGQEGEDAAGGAAKWAALEQLTALTCLVAMHCALEVVPAAFAAPPGLRVLWLAGNPSLGRAGVEALHPLTRMTALQRLELSLCSLPCELEVDAIPFPLHRLECWAERIKDLSSVEIWKLKLG